VVAVIVWRKSGSRFYYVNGFLAKWMDGYWVNLI
jgi:hypothetical protein